MMGEYLQCWIMKVGDPDLDEDYEVKGYIQKLGTENQLDCGSILIDEYGYCYDTKPAISITRYSTSTSSTFFELKAVLFAFSDSGQTKTHLIHNETNGICLSEQYDLFIDDQCYVRLISDCRHVVSLQTAAEYLQQLEQSRDELKTAIQSSPVE